MSLIEDLVEGFRKFKADLFLAFRKGRAYRRGRREGRLFAGKHANLAYLTPNPSPKEFQERYRREVEALQQWYERKRGRLEGALEETKGEMRELEDKVHFEKASPEAFAHSQAYWIQRGLLSAVFSAELVYNKLAIDALGLVQWEAYVVAFIAALVMFWLGHEAGREFKRSNFQSERGNLFIAILLFLVSLSIAVFSAFLRAAFTEKQVEILGLGLPTHLALPFLLTLGIGLVVFTFFLGYKSLTAEEVLIRKYQSLSKKERLLQSRLHEIHRRTQRGLDWLHAAYREELATYWRGFARGWPNWDPAPVFLGSVEPLQHEPLRPLESEGR